VTSPGGLARFLDPPRLRTIEEADGERRATWLELFVDLVFVVAVGQVAAQLKHDHDTLGFVEFAALFVPVWWAWVGFTFYADRYDTDDLVFRLAMFAEMFAVAAMASTTHSAFHGGSAGFAVSYFAVRAVLVAFYLRAYRAVPQTRPLTGRYSVAFGFAASLWLASLLFPTPVRYVVWGIALAIDLGTPLTARRLVEGAPISPSHIPERIGLFTLIVLGESVIAVVTGTFDTHWNAHALVAAVGGFLAACAIWWVYFDTLDTSLFKRGFVPGQIYLYMHLPLLAGLAAAGAGVQLAILDTAHGSFGAGARTAFCGGLAVCLASMAVIQYASTRMPRERDFWLRLGVAAGIVLVAATGAPVTVVMAVVVFLLAMLVLSELGHEGHGSRPEGGV
jgi:low temperature requirement protein LtrA